MWPLRSMQQASHDANMVRRAGRVYLPAHGAPARLKRGRAAPGSQRVWTAELMMMLGVGRHSEKKPTSVQNAAAMALAMSVPAVIVPNTANPALPALGEAKTMN